MKFISLQEEIVLELSSMECIVEELANLGRDVGRRELTVREKTAAAAFLAQFYNGVENVLKRISYFYAVPLPKGDNWHVALFKRFCVPPHESFPVFFDESLQLPMSTFRKFRHVVHHGYGFQLDWDRMVEGVDTVGNVFAQFRLKVLAFLSELENEGK